MKKIGKIHREQNADKHENIQNPGANEKSQYNIL